MPLPSLSELQLGAKLASAGAKASTFMSTIWVKLIAVALAIAALLFAAHLLVDQFQKKMLTEYNNGFAAGSAAQEARWQSASARNAQAQISQMAADAKQQNTAVKGYLDDLAARQPQIVKVHDEVIRYAQSPAGATQCLDDDGVRLEQEGRAAAGLDGSSGPPTGPSVTVRLPLPKPAPAPVQH